MTSRGHQEGEQLAIFSWLKNDCIRLPFEVKLACCLLLVVLSPSCFLMSMFAGPLVGKVWEVGGLGGLRANSMDLTVPDPQLMC